MKTKVLVLLFFTFGMLSSQVKTSTIDNKIFKGTINIASDSVVYNEVEAIDCKICNEQSNCFKGRILSISDSLIILKLEKEDSIYFKQNNLQIFTLKNPKNSYPLIGLGIGTPGLLNLHVGAFFYGKWGISTSLGVIGSQANLYVKTNNNYQYDLNIGISLGWYYLLFLNPHYGAFIQYDYNWFYFHAGLNLGYFEPLDSDMNHYNPKLQFLPDLQIGVVYRFK